MMRVPPILSAVTVAAACSLSPEPSGWANVLGQVLQSSGQPFGNSTVVIACRGVATTAVPTDADGRYGTNLSSPHAGTIGCVFAVPDMTTPRIRVDTAVYFGPEGQLHSLQLMNLQESAAP